MVGSTTDYRKLNQPPRLREAKVASRNLIDRVATPPWTKEGTVPFSNIRQRAIHVLEATVPSGLYSRGCDS